MIYVQFADQPIDQTAATQEKGETLAGDGPSSSNKRSALFESAARETLLHEQADPDADLTIVITGDAQVHELNRQYLEIDAPTDVLSFASGDVDPDTGNIYLGDVIISYPRALAQAQAAGHPLQAELRLLTVHGVMHLLGHDHADEDEKTRMWEAQDAILARLSECDQR